MTDNELLTLAAEAAGHQVEHINASLGAYFWFPANGQKWNPLTDDGDALRLAVKLDMEVQINRVDNLTVVLTGYSVRDLKRTVEDRENDPYAATRRAIVRAAAEIGKAA